MKKVFSLLLCAALLVGAFAGCSGGADDKTLKVGASITPHGEILKYCIPLLEEKGYTLTVVEFEDYVIPNQNVESGDLDANFFQHKPYMDNFNEENGTHLVSVAGIHYEPFGVYPGKTKSLEDLPDGGTIAVPNDGTNEARALILLEEQGLIKLKEDAGFNATVVDIVENPKNLTIQELAAPQLPRSLPDVDLAVINGNYALQAGLNANDDALVTEDKESEAAKTYTNILCVREGHENDAKIKALIEVLQSDDVRKYIEDTYQGAVIPMF